MNLLALFFNNVILFSNSSALDDIFRIITEFGSEYFYMMIIPPIFWCFNKKFGFRLLIITSFAAYIATVLKNILKVPRPPEHLWKTTPESYAFPSGHAYGSTTLWLYTMIYTKSKYIVIFGLTIIALISISRVYLGVHYFGDVLAGIALGICTVAVFLFLDPHITRIINSWSFERKMLLGTMVPLLLFFYASLFFGFDPRGVKLSGALLGIFLGYILEEKYVAISVQVSIKTKILRIIVGLFISFIVYFGLGMILPFNITTSFFASWAGGFTVMFIAPWVFTKIEPIYKK